jgi:hypothetical protein
MLHMRIKQVLTILASPYIEPTPYNSFVNGIPICELSPRTVSQYFRLWEITHRHINDTQDDFREKLYQELANYLSARHSALLESKESNDDGNIRYRS